MPLYRRKIRAKDTAQNTGCLHCLFVLSQNIQEEETLRRKSGFEFESFMVRKSWLQKLGQLVT